MKMKARFVRIDNNALTDEFQINTNPFHVGDVIDLDATVVKDVYDKRFKDYEKVRMTDKNFQGLFIIADIRHEVSIERNISTRFEHNSINILIKPC